MGSGKGKKVRKGKRISSATQACCWGMEIRESEVDGKTRHNDTNPASRAVVVIA